MPGNRRQDRNCFNAKHMATRNSWVLMFLTFALCAPLALVASIVASSPPLVPHNLADQYAQDDREAPRQTIQPHILVSSRSHAAHLQAGRFGALPHSMSLSEPLLRVLAKLSSDRMLIYDTSLPQGFGSLFYLLSQESHSVTWAVAGFLVILVQALLIVGLLLQRAQTFHVAAPRSNADRPLARCSGPEQDRTQEATENIGGRLIEAQEEERSRIARDLHDDICQRLALLSMELEQVSLESIDSNGWINPKVEEIRQHCSDIATDVQAISHQLHSSKLEYLGVVPALRSLCREFCQQHDVNVVFTDEDVPDFLPRDISLSLFRITQEALHNAQKHSGVNHFSVALRGTPDEIQLEISDKGVGFDVEEAERNEGLGLVSMQERVHLLHGLFAIDSKVNCGTRIRVCVPLVAAMKVSTAARTRTPA